MDILQLDHSRGATNIFANPKFAAAIGVAGTLLVQQLLKIISVDDPSKVVRGLVDWMLKIKTILDGVMEQIKQYKPSEAERNVWIAGGGIEQPEKMNSRYQACVTVSGCGSLSHVPDRVWSIVIKLQTHSQAAISLKYWDSSRRSEMKTLESNFKMAYKLCSKLDIRVTVSDGVFQSGCSH